MPFMNHPAFQSVLLPLVLAVLISALMRLAGLRWAVPGVAFGLVLSLAVWPGFSWPVAARAQALPWLALASTLLATLAVALKAPGTRVMGRRHGLLVSLVLVLALLGLAAWGATGGSLLLAQLALVLATVGGVVVLWAWRTASVAPVALLPLLLTGLGIAWCLAGLPQAETGGTQGGQAEDPYYAPKWK